MNKIKIGPKITVIGAGSYFFTRSVIYKMTTSFYIREGTLIFVDTNKNILDKKGKKGKKFLSDTGFSDIIQFMINIKLEKEEMEKLRISVVFLFASHAQGVSNSLSDYDFGILLKDRSILLNRNDRNEIYNGFYELISSKIKKLVNIDIVFLQEVLLQLKYHIVKDGIILYADDFDTVADFKEDTIGKYANFVHLRQEFHQSILDRI